MGGKETGCCGSLVSWYVKSDMPTPKATGAIQRKVEKNFLKNY